MSPSNNEAVSSLNIFNMIAYIANIGLVMGIPFLFGLPDNATVSGKYQTIVTPAGWAFAIWSIIFTMQAIWAILQLVSASFRANPLVVEGVAYNYIFVCAVQVGWSFSFALEKIALSMFFMLAILFFLFCIYQDEKKILDDFREESFQKSFWLFQFPFSLHFGWIIAATVVNFNIVLVAHGADASTLFASALVSLAVVVLVGGTTLFLQQDKVFPDVTIPLVLAWALNGISKELKSPRESIVNTFSQGQISTVENGSMYAAIALVVCTLVLVARAQWMRFGGSNSEESRLLN